MFERQRPGGFSMRTNTQISTRFGGMLAFAGFLSAAAHADQGKDLNAVTPIAMAAAPAQCAEAEALSVRLKYPAGTTFKLTDAGLVVLKQARPVTVGNWEPEWPNTGG
jgi:hypothetical protein